MRRLHFQWQLPEDLELPNGLTDLFGGGFTLSLADLPRLETERRGWLEVFSDPTSAYDAVWHETMPLMEGMDGDFYALDLSRPDGGIRYLSHDDGRGHGYRVGADIADLLRRWSALGCPGPEDQQWMPFTAGPESAIQPDRPLQDRWRSVLGLSREDLRSG